MLQQRHNRSQQKQVVATTSSSSPNNNKSGGSTCSPKEEQQQALPTTTIRNDNNNMSSFLTNNNNNIRRRRKQQQTTCSSFRLYVQRVVGLLWFHYPTAKDRRSSSGRHRRRLWLLAMLAVVAAMLIFVLERPTFSSNDNKGHREISSSSSSMVLRGGGGGGSALVTHPRQQQEEHLQQQQPKRHSNTTTTSATTPSLRPLRKVDYEKFTVRINTWQRSEQLQYSIQHHLSCDCIAQIQIVWCIDQGSVPDWLQELESSSESRVVVERHVDNSLNERFNVLLLETTPTYGILSIDDDVFRPCLALEYAFVMWTRNPDRQLGFDARTHQVVDVDNNNDNTTTSTSSWKYGYMSTTEKSNRYSISLTRYSFIHIDYLYWYMQYMPREIRDFVDKNFNCEDVAMSFYISSLTKNRVPLLANLWSVKSQIKMYVPKKISGGHDHKSLRDECVDSFATILHLKGNNGGNGNDEMAPSRLQHGAGGGVFEYGVEPDNWNQNVEYEQEFHVDVLDTVEKQWKSMSRAAFMQALQNMKMEATKQIYTAGLVEKTEPWKRRFQQAK